MGKPTSQKGLGTHTTACKAGSRIFLQSFLLIRAKTIQTYSPYFSGDKE